MELNTIDELIAAIKNGEMVVLLDDEDRENEGDLVIAAEAVTPEAINFIARYARGLICMPMSQKQCEKLRLPLMVPGSRNRSQYGTNFTVSIEARHGVTTGISAADRAVTVAAAATVDSSYENIVQPGHIFPLMALPGGVLERAGHTEAACDLAKLAGFNETAVLAEIMNDDGSMARRPELEVFAKEHGLKIGTIADLIRHRLQTEATIVKIMENPIETLHGDFNLTVFQDVIHPELLHIAYVCGKPTPQQLLPVRVLVCDKISTLPGMIPLDPNSWPLTQALNYISKQGCGAVVLLAKLEEPVEIIEKLGTLHLEKAQRAALKSSAPTRPNRLIGAGAQILSQLGFGRIQVLGVNEKYSALSGFNLEIEQYIPFGE